MESYLGNIAGRSIIGIVLCVIALTTTGRKAEKKDYVRASVLYIIAAVWQAIDLFNPGQYARYNAVLGVTIYYVDWVVVVPLAVFLLWILYMCFLTRVRIKVFNELSERTIQTESHKHTQEIANTGGETKRIKQKPAPTSTNHDSISAKESSERVACQGWVNLFLAEVDSLMPPNQVEDMRLTLQFGFDDIAIYEQALIAASKAWSAILVSTALQPQDDWSKEEQEDINIRLDYLAKALGLTREKYNKYISKASIAYKGALGLNEQPGVMGLDTGGVGIDLFFDIYDDLAPSGHKTTPPDAEAKSLSESCHVPSLRWPCFSFNLLPRALAAVSDRLQIGHTIAKRYRALARQKTNSE